jgi:methionyl-tRNA formyltransferase
MTLEAELDTGPVHLKRRVAIDAKTLTSLLGELATVGAQALTEVLASTELLVHPRAQEGDVTYAAKLTKEDFHLTSDSSAAQLLRIVRLGQAFTLVAGRRLLVESAVEYDGAALARGSIALRDGAVILGAAEGAIALEIVRPESAKSMSATAWWTGARLDEAVVRWT